MPDIPHAPTRTTTSHDPRDGHVVATLPDTTSQELDAVLDAAGRAAPALASTPPGVRGRWLAAVADALVAEVDALVDVADRETALGRARLHGEVLRTAEQLRFYAAVATEGSWLRVTLDRATETAPALARAHQPLGPVAVFGASNFPFAFGVLGNDTASALAAGCPVVAKAHPAHAATCALLHDLATTALTEAGAPAGTFTTVHGFEAGPALVSAPQVKAVGFTGSQAGGLALWRLANEREEVIPFYAEMGTVNPVVLAPALARAELDAVAAGFVASFTTGSGQFCTKPGLLLAPVGCDAPATVARALEAAAPAPVMLTRGIADSVGEGLVALAAAGATTVTRTEVAGPGWRAPAAVLTAPVEALTRGSRLLEECFGAVALVVEYASLEELHAALDQLQGCLAAAVFAAPDDPDAPALIDRLARVAGRVTMNDWPTGVAWTWAQHHGGPWPATTRPEATSVGAAALDRFVRPVTFQSVPTDLLPSPHRELFADDNPWLLPRRVDGRLEGMVTP